MQLLLEKQLETGRLSHAYLFKGSVGAGKKSAAHEFAEKLLNTTALSSHPDFTLLGVEEKVAVEQVRGLIAKLSVKPFRAAYTVAIIENAHLLNASASNALLKQLEEPSPTSIIILVASGSVLPTISSRCQSIVFNRQSAPVFAQEIKEKVDKLENLRSMGTASSLASLKEFAELDAEDLDQIFVAWLYRVKSHLGANPAQFTLARALISAQKQLKTNVNKKFIFQQLFLLE